MNVETLVNLVDYEDKDIEVKMKEIKPIMEKFGHLEKVYPLKEFVKVDSEVSGCPIIEEKFVECMENYLKEFEVV